MRQLKWVNFDFNSEKCLKELFNKKDNYEDGEEENPSLFINTPFGPASMLNPFAAIKDFNYHMFSVDFDMEAYEYEIIKALAGVEVCIKTSRYRYVVAIGELFDVFMTKFNIEKRF